MSVRAVICDIYGTLLQAGPPPPDAAARWLRGSSVITGHILPLAEFNNRCSDAVASQHALRRQAGEPFPEVDWPAVVRTAFQDKVDHESALRLSSLHAACSRSCTAMPGAVAALDALHRAGLLIGLASNAQHYTRDELSAAGFSLQIFHPALTFLSGDHGFAKPSPRVFSHLTKNLATLGIEPSQTLMAGDSRANDMDPARAAGWQTWLMGGGGGGTWEQLMEETLPNPKSE